MPSCQNDISKVLSAVSVVLFQDMTVHKTKKDYVNKKIGARRANKTWFTVDMKEVKQSFLTLEFVFCFFLWNGLCGRA